MAVDEEADIRVISTADSNTGILQSRLLRFSDPHTARRWAEQALQSANEQSNDLNRAHALFCLANLDCDRGLFKESAALLREALELYTRLGDQLLKCDVLCMLANVKHRTNEYSESLRLTQESLQLARKLDHHVRIADNYALQGAIAHHLGDNEVALGHLDTSEDLYKQSGVRPQMAFVGLGRVFTVRGFICQTTGKYDQSLEYLQAALAEFRHHFGHSAVAGGLINLGVNYGRQNLLDEAEEYFEQALGELRHLQNRKQMAIISTNMASLNLARERLERALEQYQDALKISREEDFKTGEAHALLGIGSVYSNQGKFDLAESYLQDSEAVASNMQSKSLHVDVCRRIAQMYERKSDLANALEYYKKLHDIERELFNDESNSRLSRYRILRDSEAARSEEEIHRLKNVELASANSRLEELIRTKNNFLGIAAHDLKNPIASIKAMAQLILFQGDDLTMDEVRDYCGDILSNSDRMLKLVNNLLDLNKIERGHLNICPVDFDMVEQVRQFAALSQHLANNKNIAIQVTAESDSACVHADRDVTVQILDNLLSNAIKFSDAGSQVEIKISCNNGAGRVAVIDQGPGVAPEEIPLLFGNFSRLSAQPTGGESSTGLGLAIVKQLVEAMDGKIWCESEWGHGAAFYVDLPGARESNEKTPSAPAC